MRAKGIREGNPRADDEAMGMAIKMGDASPEVAPVLKALTQMKSINTKMGLYWNPYPDMVHWWTGSCTQKSVNALPILGAIPRPTRTSSS